MLVDVTLLPRNMDPAFQAIFKKPVPMPTRLRRGVYACPGWNFENAFLEPVVPGELFFDPRAVTFLHRLKRRGGAPFADPSSAPHPAKLRRLHSFQARRTGRYIDSYGVCDRPEQLLSLYDFEADPRPLVLSLARLRKEDEPPDGGWRWHKWGEYVGEQQPQCEYLAHEPVIEEVWTYSVYQVSVTPGYDLVPWKKAAAAFKRLSCGFDPTRVSAIEAADEQGHAHTIVVFFNALDDDAIASVSGHPTMRPVHLQRLGATGGFAVYGPDFDKDVLEAMSARNGS